MRLLSHFGQRVLEVHPPPPVLTPSKLPQSKVKRELAGHLYKPKRHNVVVWLNEHGYRTRKGARWGAGPMHKMVTNTVYKGDAVFNRTDSKTRERRPADQHVIVPVPPIIDPVTFDALQAQLKSRNPKVTPPRVVTGPILLTGVATCANCGGAMTLRTGKSGRYRYYTCATAARNGKNACPGRSVPMDQIDKAVMNCIADQLLTSERVRALLHGLMKRQSEMDVDLGRRLTALRSEVADAEVRLRRLYTAIENGIADESDQTLKDRLEAVKKMRDTARVAFDRAADEMRPEVKITEDKIAAFVTVMRQSVLEGSTAFRRAYLRSVIDQVEIDDTEIRIRGRKTVLERLVMGGGAAPTGVPSFDRKWRAG